MDMPGIGGLTEENLRTIRASREFLDNVRVKPEVFWPFLRPCQVKVLLLTDGNLDFSEGDFGLSTFVRALLDMPGGYVGFRVTLGHINNVSATQMMDGETRIVRRITGFKFDDTGHFTPDMYDEVWLFGISPSFFGRGTDPRGRPYPSDRLGDGEVRALTEFMNGGGGLFATGDHGFLGRALCQAVPRARNMRLWASTSAQNQLDEVSMTGARRNDTNRIGSSVPGSEFNDQSDDTPQTVQPRMYQRTNGIFRATFPHPLLCGPRGVIRIMPDHPHEGECVEPTDTSQSLAFDGAALGQEYPGATDGGPQPLPEVVSTSTVLSGTTSGGKAATVPGSFGGICAYDGHRAGIGRVVTDATWHHFVNVNLIGEIGPPATDPKSRNFPGGGGFLATATGRAHLEEIRAYYRNLAVWTAPPGRIACMNTRILWELVWNHRVLEAVLTTTDVRLADVRSHILMHIGRHARDVLGRFASQCQSVRLILDLVLRPALPELIPDIDPWLPGPPRRLELPDEVTWFDGAPLLDIALGAALVGLREAFPQPDEQSVSELETERLVELAAEAGRAGVERAMASAVENAAAVRAMFEAGYGGQTASAE